MDELTKENVKSLLLKGFTKEETKEMLKEPVDLEEIREVAEKIGREDMTKNSIDFYTDLQKDLAKLVITELRKQDRDSSVIFNAIKTQAELQDKKLILSKGKIGEEKINKDYIFKRDEEILKLKKEGINEEEISKRLDIGILSVKQSIDRAELDIPTEWREKLNPSIISETTGLDTKTRMSILKEAYDNNLKRQDVRALANKIKNEMGR